MSSAPMVRARRLAKSYPSPDGGRTTVLADIDLDIDPAEFVVILGRSGSGKTTLLNLLGLLDRPSDGSLELAGRRVDALSEAELAGLRRGWLGFVFQDYSLIATLTVAQNLSLPLALTGVPAAEHPGRVAAALAEIDLAGLEQRFPDQLSGGQQQRVAVARALIHGPRLVLADEPTGNLDVDTAKVVVERLDAATRRLGGTLVMVTHSREVMGAADQCFALDHGRLRPVAP